MGPNATPVRVGEVRVFVVPTDQPESDGTFAWDKTTVVTVDVEAGGHTGLGVTYASKATAALVDGGRVVVRGVRGAAVRAHVARAPPARVPVCAQAPARRVVSRPRANRAAVFRRASDAQKRRDASSGGRATRARARAETCRRPGLRRLTLQRGFAQHRIQKRHLP